MSATVFSRTNDNNVHDTFTPANLNRISTLLKGLQRAWRSTEPDSEDDEDDEADNRFVLRLLETRHPCLRELVTSHPLFLRASGSSCGVQVYSVLSGMQRAIRVLARAASDGPNSPAQLVQHDFIKAFMATQPAHAAAAVVSGHRQRLADCRGNRAAELDALSRAVAAWVEAAALAELIWDIYFRSTIRQQGVVLDALAGSHLLVHLCALRLDLAEGISRLSDNPTAGPSGQGSHDPGAKPGSQQQWVEQQQLLLLAQLQAADTDFLDYLRIVLRCCSEYSEVCLDVVRNRVEVSLLCNTPAKEQVLHAALSHPAVHCLLGWWLVAPGVAAGCPGAKAWGLPEGLVRHVAAMADPYERCAAALYAAVTYWEGAHRLRGAEPPPGPQRPAETAAFGAATAVDTAGAEEAGAAAGAGTGDVVIDLVPWDELSGGAAAGGSSARGGEGTGPLPGSGPVRHPLPYSRSQVYKLVAAALRFLSRNNAPTDDAHRALSAAVGLLVRDLLAMPRAKATRRLASTWGLLLPALACGWETYETFWGLHVGRMLGELPYLWRQQLLGQGQEEDRPWAEGERQQQQRHGRGAGGGGSGGCAAGISVTTHSAGGGGRGSGGGAQSSSGGVQSGRWHSDARGQPPHEDSGGPIPGINVGGNAANGGPTNTSSSSSPSAAAAAAATRPPAVVTCALQAGLVPALEGHIRKVFCSALSDIHAWDVMDCALGFVDLALRRHGCWPAMLAYGDPLHAAALVVSLCKCMRALAAAPVGYVVHRKRAVLRLELLALLEQLLPSAVGCGSTSQGAGGCGPAEGSSSGAAPGSGGCIGGAARWRAGLLDLQLNRGLSKAREEEEEGAGGSAGGGGWGPDAPCSRWAPAWAAGPTWRQVEEAGGYPAPGTPAQQQQVQLTAVAVVELLPEAITWPDGPPGAVLALSLSELVAHGAYRMAWGWLRLVARQVVKLPGDTGAGVGGAGSGGGGESGDGSGGDSDEGAFPTTHGSLFRCEWADFLLGTLAAADQVQQVLSAAHSVPQAYSKRGGRYSDEVAELVRAAVRELLPAALDLMEVLAVAAPREVVDAVSGYMDGGQRLEQGLTLPWEADFMEIVEEQQGRRKLAGLIRALLREEEKVKWAWGELKGEVEARLVREGLPLLPGPYVDVGFWRCRNGACTRLEGRSEAELELQTCPACGAVAYCCRKCRIKDWKAGHYEECDAA